MRLKKVLTLALIAACGMGLASCTAESKKTEQVMTQEKATYQKKYTNADFYKDGKFDQEAAKEAFLDMFKFYGVPYTPLMEKDIWFTDFGLGDFENVGMGGIFWVNDPEYGYFAHAIYLLPGQMIPEHAHVKTAFPAKHESWMVNHGWVYNFSEVGDETPNAPAVPASHGPIQEQEFREIVLGLSLKLSGQDRSILSNTYLTRLRCGGRYSKMINLSHGILNY